LELRATKCKVGDGMASDRTGRRSRARRARRAADEDPGHSATWPEAHLRRGAHLVGIDPQVTACTIKGAFSMRPSTQRTTSTGTSCRCSA